MNLLKLDILLIVEVETFNVNILDLSSLLTSHLKSFLTVIEREIEHNETTKTVKNLRQCD
jgi:hypothetical protein